MIAELGITLWSGEGTTVAFEHSRELLDEVQPQYVQLHSGPDSLRRLGGALTKRVRAALQSTGVVWAIAGDAYLPNPVRFWSQAARAAEDNGVRVLMLNCERGWKSSKLGTLAHRNALARSCVEAVRQAAPSVELWFTSYAAPTSVLRDPRNPRAGRFGGHGTFPWWGFLGGGHVAEHHPQVYTAPKDGSVAQVGALPRFDEWNTRSIEAAARKGWIAPSVRHGVYLQAHHTPLRDLCAVGERHEHVSLWASHTRIDEDGRKAARVLAELARRRIAIRELQTLFGLTPDGIVGPRTLAALGL